MGLKIMVVDQEQDYVTSLTPALTRGNHQIVSARTPQDALNAFRSESPAVVLLDVNFTGTQAGLDLIQQFRAVNRSVPIIMLSGTARTDLVVKSIKSGANDFFEKQNSHDSLLLQIESVLTESKNIALNENTASNDLSDSTSVAEIEYKALVSALEQCGGNISKVAKLLNLSRDTVYRRLKKFSIGIKRDYNGAVS